MFKGKILLIALAIMLVASVANAAIFKYPVGTADEGTVVGYDGAAVDGTLTDDLVSETRAMGIVIQNDGTDAMVANSGIFDLPAAGTFSAGDILGYTDAGVLEAITAGSGRPVAGIAISDTRVMITIENDEAKWTAYDYEAVSSTEAGFLGVAGSHPNDVQEALDAIDTFLGTLSATLFDFHATTTTAAIGGASSDVELVSVTNTFAAGVPGIVENDEFYLTFEGEFVDDINNNGAVITLAFYNAGDAAEIGAPREIYLLNRDFYQKQVVHMELFYTATASTDETWSVQADGDDTYDGGQFLGGSISAERF